MADSNRCGPHTELVNNGTIRVSRCQCGTVHLHMIPSGVTLRLTTEQFRLMSAGVRASVDKLDEAAPPRIDSTCIN